MQAADNLVVSDYRPVAHAGLIDGQLVGRRSAELAARIGFDPKRIRQLPRQLSGGNQQKLLIGRWLHSPPQVLLADEPTRGIDIGAKAEILDCLVDFARSGRSIEEVIAISDRVLVLANGRVVGAVSRSPDLTVATILRMAFEL
jgi:rhamnose transport system ATP-binding protein